MNGRLELSELRTPVRLWAAALLCLAPMGLRWSASPGYLNTGYTIYGDCGYTDYDYCTPDYYVPGYYIPGKDVLVSESPIRVFLVLAAIAFLVAALRTRTATTRNLARGGTVCLALAAVLCAANNATLVLVCMLAGLALTARPVWGVGLRTAGVVFVPRAGRG